MADLYNQPMPEKLLKAHQKLDRAVHKAYINSIWKSEDNCISDLMRMYQQLLNISSEISSALEEVAATKS